MLLLLLLLSHYLPYYLSHYLNQRKLREEWFSECGVDQEELKKVKTIWEFEEYVFSRVYGWTGAEDYYNRFNDASDSLNLIRFINFF